ncbi:UDP-glucuronosyl/UDP-glucosyltransferase, partial [Trinorchestia longiramus]
SVLLLSCMVILFVMMTSLTQGYNILIALLLESKSVHRLYQTLARNLVAANHSVTLITSYNATFSHPKFVNFNVMGSEPLEEGNAFEMVDMGDGFTSFNRKIVRIGSRMWENESVKELWERRHSFDAMMMPDFGNSIFLPFTFNFTGPLMMIVAPGVDYFPMSLDGNWLPPSVVPCIFLPYDESMNFFERVENVFSLWEDTKWRGKILSTEKAFLEKRFPNVGDLSRYYEKSSLTFINSHPAMENPVPLLPNQIEIGLLNARRAEPLPKDLEDFIESSGDHGVIYFSLGTFTKSTDIPSRAKLAFVEAFRRVPQKVIWGYDGDDLDLPANVLKRSFLPQQDILGHPKTRVYISHCGIQSTQEAKYHGVPVLAVPVSFDQPRNAARMVRKNIAVSLSWDTLTADHIVEALNILINDTSYSARMKQLSAVLQDQKESPGERAVWWIEYVIRHRGAPHLQYTGKQLHFLQYICADIIAFLVVCLYISYRLFKAIVLIAFGLVFPASKQHKLK